MYRSILTFCVLTACMLCAVQTQADDNKTARQKYEEFKKKGRKHYDDFREQANHEYALFIEKAWEQYQMEPGVPRPVREELEPVIWESDSTPTVAACAPDGTVEIIKTAPPKPQPLPVSPIIPYDWANQDTVRFSYYGTDVNVRYGDKQHFTLPDLSPKTIAEVWRQMSNARYNNTLQDCLAIRNDMGLNDWAYLQMLLALAESIYGKGNEANLLVAYIYTQSGYKTRLIKTVGDPDPKLSLLFGTEYLIYDRSALKKDGLYYYPIDGKFNIIEYVNFPFPNEQSMSLEITHELNLRPEPSDVRHIESVRYPHVRADVCVDKNLIKFFDDYPVYSKDDNFMSKWAYYANTPLDPMVKRQLYPQLQEYIDTENKNQGVEQLLNLVQSSMPYGYDNEIWGYDRAFFSEESLFYPLSDCEDHAILFSRLVRDLLGLDVLLVYYPGHLATAVDMGEDYPGDGVRVDGKRYTICDPILRKPAGYSHPNVDKTQIEVIQLSL